MSDQKPEKKVKPPQVFGWMAEYDDEHKFLEAARKVRDSGYTKTDAFAPFPVHGIDEALGIKPTVLPWFTLIAGATGTMTALVMQIWMNAVDYPYIISGKPFVSLPAFIPVTFELTVLFAAFTTVFAMLGLNGLPKFSNPVFTNPKFDRVTDDRFFLWVDSRDKYFNSDKVKALLENTSPLNVEEVREDDSQAEVPRKLYFAIGTFILATLIPAVVVWNIRAVNSESPRWHVFFDMDFMPFRKPQKETTIFADGRTQRPPVPGTVARGAAPSYDPYYLGYSPEPSTADLPAAQSEVVRLVSAQDDPVPQESKADQPPAPKGESPSAESPQPSIPAEPKAGESKQNDQPKPADQSAPSSAQPAASQDAAPQPPASAGGPAAAQVPDRNYLQKLPEQLPANEELFALGRRKFEQVCSACHGFAGYGNGLVSKRAEALQASYWLQPTSVHDERILKQPIGQIYFTITNGKGKMAGYGSTLNVKERWAVALYVKALQRSQRAQESDLAQEGN